MNLKYIQGPVIENISLRCGGFLKSLSLRGCRSVEDQSIKTLAVHCRNIEYLDLSDCKVVTDSSIQALSRHCSKLHSINLESCINITDSSLKALSDGCQVRLYHIHKYFTRFSKLFSQTHRLLIFQQNLIELNISWCHQITEKGIEALARGCTKLKKISCKGCKEVNDRAVIFLSKYCHNIEILNLHNCNVSIYFPIFELIILIALKILLLFISQAITDASIVKLAEKCNNLKQLCVSKCSELTDQTLIALAQHNPFLNTLEVAGCNQFTDLGFQALGKVIF